jgi:hypothetical protein
VLATGAGWIMKGWPDADSMLDQLLELTAPQHRGDLARSAQLAQTAARSDAGGPDLIVKSYAAMLAGTATTGGQVDSLLPMYEAASRALGRGPSRPTAGGQAQGSVKKGRLFRLFRR